MTFVVQQSVFQVCCLPFRSVRHLQEASQTDGKAAINLQKLKLFQHFYVMVRACVAFSVMLIKPISYEGTLSQCFA